MDPRAAVGTAEVGAAHGGGTPVPDGATVRWDASKPTAEGERPTKRACASGRRGNGTKVGIVVTVGAKAAAACPKATVAAPEESAEEQPAIPEVEGGSTGEAAVGGESAGVESTPWREESASTEAPSVGMNTGAERAGTASGAMEGAPGRNAGLASRVLGPAIDEALEGAGPMAMAAPGRG